MYKTLLAGLALLASSVGAQTTYQFSDAQITLNRDASYFDSLSFGQIAADKWSFVAERRINDSFTVSVNVNPGTSAVMVAADLIPDNAPPGTYLAIHPSYQVSLGPNRGVGAYWPGKGGSMATGIGFGQVTNLTFSVTGIPGYVTFTEPEWWCDSLDCIVDPITIGGTFRLRLLVTAVPEPEAILMVGFGVAVVAAARRRKVAGR